MMIFVQPRVVIKLVSRNRKRHISIYWEGTGAAGQKKKKKKRRRRAGHL
jgi:hypothetical protein